MRTSLTASHVLGHRNGSHVLFRDATVVYEDDVIVHVGHGFKGAVDESIDLGHALLAPGLIDLDALTDIDHLLLDSWHSSEAAKGLTWSGDYFTNRRRDVFSPQERQTIRRYALVQLALHGITTYMPIASEVHSAWAEDLPELVGMAETSRELGLRGYLGPAYRSGVNIIDDDGVRTVLFDPPLGEAGLADALAFLDYADALDDPLVTGVLLPCRIETLTPELMRATAQASAERNVLVRLHSLQGMAERDYLAEAHSSTPLQMMASAGLLNDRLLVPHGILIDRHRSIFGEDRGDLATLAAAGVSVIHCPQTSFRYGSVLDSFSVYKEAGINLCLGTDSFPPDLVRGMDAGVHLAKLADRRSDSAPASDYFDAATLGGAAALKRPDLGRLEPGAQADIVAFSLSDFRDGVIDDPLRTLLLNGTARNAVHSVVAGRTVMANGTLPGVDLPALAAAAQPIFEKMRGAYSERDWRGRSAAELFPSSYPAAD
ncbi:chlorohydrolase family protein [Arthrobacter sp. 35W]|uniref:chlorohydrolase family protein n=1 Tax=Arthrobacter sp. 35W TaxID=1132441 RepID=UPI00042A2DA0|nr:chlorohydrolase family protein [Arthrobacter sp. 35W]